MTISLGFVFFVFLKVFDVSEFLQNMLYYTTTEDSPAVAVILISIVSLRFIAGVFVYAAVVYRVVQGLCVNLGFVSSFYHMLTPFKTPPRPFFFSFGFKNVSKIYPCTCEWKFF